MNKRAGYALEDALHLVINATTDRDIKRALDGLSDPEVRWLNGFLDDTYGSDVEDMLAEPDFDKQEWIQAIAATIRQRDAFRESR